MSSKTSFFSKAIFRSDIRRFWWISAIETLFVVLTCVLPVYHACMHSYAYSNSPMWDGALIIPLIFGTGTGIALFSYLNAAAPVSTMHSYPITRTGLFVTKLSSASVILVSPIIIAGILLFAIMPLSNGGYHPADVLIWIGTGLIYSYIMLSLTTIVTMMTGNSIATLVFTVGFCLLPLMLNSLFELVLSENLYGYSQPSFGDGILSNIYIGPYGIEDGEYVWNYPVMSVIFLCVAYLMYRIRNLESFGEVIAFNWLKPIFIVIVATLTSCISYAYFLEFMDIESLFMVLPLGIIGTMAAYMIAKKSIDFKGSIKSAGIYCIGAILVVMCIFFDVTGYEKRVPTLSETEGVSVEIHGLKYSRDYSRTSRVPDFTRSEDISAVINAHKELSQDKSARFRRYTNGEINIKYHLKNGKTAERRYPVDLNSDRDILRPIVETQAFRNLCFGILGNDKKEYQQVEIWDRRMNDSIIYYPNDEEFEVLTNAIVQDIETMSYSDFVPPMSSTNVSIVWFTTGDDGEPISMSQRIEITDATVNTKNVLDEIVGIRLPVAEDISSITVYGHDNKTKNPTEHTVTHEETIAEMYKLYDDMVEDNYYSDYNDVMIVELSYLLKDGRSFHVSCQYKPEDLPEIFRPYFE